MTIHVLSVDSDPVQRKAEKRENINFEAWNLLKLVRLSFQWSFFLSFLSSFLLPLYHIVNFLPSGFQREMMFELHFAS